MSGLSAMRSARRVHSPLGMHHVATRADLENRHSWPTTAPEKAGMRPFYHVLTSPPPFLQAFTLSRSSGMGQGFSYVGGRRVCRDGAVPNGGLHPTARSVLLPLVCPDIEF
jgi:hypothetical protein